jgi:autophagy-related protein 33
VAFLGGQGVEVYYNGLSRFPGRGKEAGYVDVGLEEVNGEKVEAEMGRERWTQAVRTGICGVGFVMGVVGVWGDGA